MRTLTRDHVRNLITDLNEWHKYITHPRWSGSGTTTKLADEHPETIAAAREVLTDLQNRGTSAPRLREWINHPDDEIPNSLMSELGRIAMELPRRNGLSFDEALSRKTSAALREVIIAVRDAIPNVQSRYERDEELPVLFERLLDPSLKTASGSTMHETLRKLYEVLDRARGDHPAVTSAANKLADAIGRR